MAKEMVLFGLIKRGSVLSTQSIEYGVIGERAMIKFPGTKSFGFPTAFPNTPLYFGLL